MPEPSGEYSRSERWRRPRRVSGASVLEAGGVGVCAKIGAAISPSREAASGRGRNMNNPPWEKNKGLYSRMGTRVNGRGSPLHRLQPGRRNYHPYTAASE